MMEMNMRMRIPKNRLALSRKLINVRVNQKKKKGRNFCPFNPLAHSYGDTN
jgi:hypothetical protein